MKNNVTYKTDSPTKCNRGQNRKAPRIIDFLHIRTSLICVLGVSKGMLATLDITDTKSTKEYVGY